ncbi:hypothetical protein GCM10023340_08660 [Nocardioides marinquilinus]|uniref:Holin n=1 Tax=Nocardioides marinquilinus TaxID=1210400 RepID=A0ABP9PAC5_9ACTN
MTEKEPSAMTEPTHVRVPETVPATAVAVDTMPTTQLEVAVTPTQVRRPWRSTARSAFQALVGLCVLMPLLIGAAGLDPAKVPLLAGVVGVAAAVTRIMAIPAVEEWLRRFLPFLAAAPRPKRRHRPR